MESVNYGNLLTSLTWHKMEIPYALGELKVSKCSLIWSNHRTFISKSQLKKSDRKCKKCFNKIN